MSDKTSGKTPLSGLNPDDLRKLLGSVDPASLLSMVEMFKSSLKPEQRTMIDGLLKELVNKPLENK